MPNFAKIYLIGHVGNIKTRYTPNGKQIISFSVAVNRYRNDDKFTDWFYILTSQDWVMDEIAPGDLVFVEGTPEFSESNGQKYMNIWMNKLRILRKKEVEEEFTRFDDVYEPKTVENVGDEIPF